MKILFLSRWLPYPPANGSKLRLYHLLKRLSANHQLDLITFYDGEDNPSQSIPELQKFCRKVIPFRYKSFQPATFQALKGFLSARPRSVQATFQPELASAVEQCLATEKYDVLIASQIDMAVYGLAAAKYSVPALLEELEIGVIYHQYQQATGIKNKLRHRLTWTKLASYVKELARSYRFITVASDTEQAIVVRLVNPARLEVLPNAADLEFYQFNAYNLADRANRLVFNGALTFKLNFEAMRYFLAEVLPGVRQQHPEIELYITGSTRELDKNSLTDNHPGRLAGVTFTGFVDDLRPVVAQSAIAVAPLLQGGGTRLKILEAFALGTPVVATSKGAEGLAVEHGKHLIIADNPQHYISAIHQLLTDPQLAQSISFAARQLVEKHYNWDMVAARLENLLLKL